VTYLLTDIGGTHTRCALYENGSEDIRAVQIFLNSSFESPTALLTHYLDALPPTDRPDSGVFAVAAPITGETINMVNIDWQFSITDLRDALGLGQLRVLNDFEALAYALPVLASEQMVKVGGGEILDGKPKVVLGPGTGLGVAVLAPIAGGWQAISGEGGHVTLAASNDREASLLGLARARFGHCSAERLISGPGLSLIHSLLHKTEPLEPARISALAIAEDPQAMDTFEVFFQLLSTVASDLAVTLGSFGGVYLGGGIVCRHLKRVSQSGFRQRFEAKGRYLDYLKRIPTFVIVEDQPTLIGLAAYARNA
jgi:glucokinase